MKEELYQLHSMTLVKDVIPKEDLKGLVNIFMIDAGINMGNEFTSKSLERVIWIIENRYRYLPVYIIASGFTKGSMGAVWARSLSSSYHRRMDEPD